MLTCCWHPCLPDSVIFTLSSLFRGSYAHPYLKLSFNDACLCKQYGSPTVAPSALPSQTAERMWEFLNYIWFAHYGEIVFSFHFFFFFKYVLVSSVELRDTVSFLSAEFLPNISYQLSSLRSIVFGLCFRAVFVCETCCWFRCRDGLR